MKNQKNYFHIFHKPTKIPKIQNDFLFFDCESKVFEKTNDYSKQKLILGCCKYWNRTKNFTKDITFKNSIEFFNFIESLFSPMVKSLICFAHNLQFDFTMVNGFSELNKRGWVLKTLYAKGNVTIFTFKLLYKIDEKKRKHYLTLSFWDSLNYVPVSVKQIGKNVGSLKLEIDLNNCSLEELEVYCRQDVNIIYLYIKYLTDFLELHQLGKLKATMSSLSLSAFRNKFIPECNLYIHSKERVIKLERRAYKGGITDVFLHNKPVFCIKTDINSMYPYIMLNKYLPQKLIFYGSSKNFKDKNKIRLLYEKYNQKEDFGIIASISFDLPKDKANILLYNPKLKKLCFSYGNKLKGCFCSPELQYIEKYGKILKIYEIAIYKLEKIFEKYVKFFYEFKKQYSIEKKEVFREITKRYMTNLYGKWGQYQEEFNRLHLTKEEYYKHKIGLENVLMEYKNETSLYYMGVFDELGELYYINKTILQKKRLKTNVFDSFVAISSFITSYARILLMNYRMISGIKDTYYTDTDSLYVSELGFKRLKRNGLIENLELGKLKVEGSGIGCFYNPKFFDFFDFSEINTKERKIKGVNQNKAILLEENELSVSYQIESWERLKTSLRKQRGNIQVINYSPKVISKVYSKGNVDCKGWTLPNLMS